MPGLSRTAGNVRPRSASAAAAAGNLAPAARNQPAPEGKAPKKMPQPQAQGKQPPAAPAPKKQQHHQPEPQQQDAAQEDEDDDKEKRVHYLQKCVKCAFVVRDMPNDDGAGSSKRQVCIHCFAHALGPDYVHFCPGCGGKNPDRCALAQRKIVTRCPVHDRNCSAAPGANGNAVQTSRTGSAYRHLANDHTDIYEAVGFNLDAHTKKKNEADAAHAATATPANGAQAANAGRGGGGGGGGAGGAASTGGASSTRRELFGGGGGGGGAAASAEDDYGPLPMRHGVTFHATHGDRGVIAFAVTNTGTEATRIPLIRELFGLPKRLRHATKFNTQLRATAQKALRTMVTALGGSECWATLSIDKARINRRDFLAVVAMINSPRHDAPLPVLIKLVEVTGKSCTGEVVCDALLDATFALHNYGVNVRGATADRAGNMKKGLKMFKALFKLDDATHEAFRSSGFETAPCINHLVQSIVGDVRKHTKVWAALVKKIKEQRAALVALIGGGIRDWNETRWFTEVDMVIDVVDAQPRIMALNEKLALTDVELAAAKAFIAFHEPLRIFSDLCQANACTALDVLCSLPLVINSLTPPTGEFAVNIATAGIANDDAAQEQEHDEEGGGDDDEYVEDESDESGEEESDEGDAAVGEDDDDDWVDIGSDNDAVEYSSDDDDGAVVDDIDSDDAAANDPLAVLAKVLVRRIDSELATNFNVLISACSPCINLRAVAINISPEDGVANVKGMLLSLLKQDHIAAFMPDGFVSTRVETEINSLLDKSWPHVPRWTKPAIIVALQSQWAERHIPIISSVVLKLARIMPSESVVERFFSVIAFVMNKQRAKMHAQNLEDRVVIRSLFSAPTKSELAPHVAERFSNAVFEGSVAERFVKAGVEQYVAVATEMRDQDGACARCGVKFTQAQRADAKKQGLLLQCAFQDCNKTWHFNALDKDKKPYYCAAIANAQKDNMTVEAAQEALKHAVSDPESTWKCARCAAHEVSQVSQSQKQRGSK
jgi:hypothetical protein